jgi:hypothetical protein
MTDEITQAEKKQVLLKDCYLSRAVADADQSGGGRWKKQTETRVTGVPQYPRQPSNSPWSQSLDDLTGREGPLGFEEFVGALGGESSAPVVMASTVETANATDRGESPTALTDSPRFLRRRRV